jgi:hypothetical protein
MKKCTAIDLQLPAAQAPVGTQQEMIPKKCVFRFTQNTASYEAKIGRIFLFFPRIRAAAVPPSQMIPGNRTGVCPQLDALPEAVVTSAENTPKHAVTWNFFVAADKACAGSLAVYAGGARQANSVGPTPIHNFNPFPSRGWPVLQGLLFPGTKSNIY